MLDVKNMITNTVAFTSEVVVTGTATLAKVCAEALKLLPSVEVGDESASINMSSMPIPMMVVDQNTNSSVL